MSTASQSSDRANVEPPYPVTLEIREASTLERPQLVVRILVFIVIGMLGESTGGLFLLLYVLLPVVAAVLVTHRQGVNYIGQDAPWLCAVFGWVLALLAYLVFVTDRFPLEPERRAVRLRIRTSGNPTASSALARLVTSLPHALFLCLLGLLSGIFWLVSALLVLVGEPQPRLLQKYQIAFLERIARVFAYHASLVEPYPPISFGPL